MASKRLRVFKFLALKAIYQAILKNHPILLAYSPIGKINTTTSALQDAINALIMLQLNSVKTNVSGQ